LEVQTSVKFVEGSAELTSIPGFLNEILDKSKEEIGKIEIAASDSVVITPISLEYIRGLLISSDNRIKVEVDPGGGYEERGRGSKILINELNAPNIKLTNLDKEIDRAEILTVDVSGGDDIITIDNWDDYTNYTYSKLIGTVIEGPFNLTGARFVFNIYSHTNIIVELGEISGDTPDDRAATAALEIEADINDQLGFEAVEVAYDTVNNYFTVTAKRSGAELIEFSNNVAGCDQLYIGMSNPTLRYGTDDYTGKMIEILTGDDAGSTYEIKAISGNQITIDGDFASEPAAGDKIRIYDPEEDCEVDVVMWR